MNKKKAFCCWSGGKESALSFYKAKKKGFHISYLLNMVSDDGKYSRTHGVSSKLLQKQAGVIGIPIIQRKTTWETYEEEFKKAVLSLKKEGIETGIFGDIDLQEHRDWAERVCNELCIEPILPLWKVEREKLLKEFIQAGFKAVVVAVNSEFLGKEYLGREIDKKFMEMIKTHDNVDLCGEKGEYHTLVYEGPIFNKSINFTFGRKVFHDKHWFLELF